MRVVLWLASFAAFAFATVVDLGYTLHNSTVVVSNEGLIVLFYFADYDSRMLLMDLHT